jgi:hypothetical protein
MDYEEVYLSLVKLYNAPRHLVGMCDEYCFPILTTVSIATFGMKTLSINETNHNYVLFIVMLNVSILCQFAECHYVECQYYECHYTECQYAECHNTEC